VKHGQAIYIQSQVQVIQGKLCEHVLIVALVPT